MWQVEKALADQDVVAAAALPSEFADCHSVGQRTAGLGAAVRAMLAGIVCC
jgi:hypothetical protein